MRLLTSLCVLASVPASPAQAEQPFGWTGIGHPSAYALAPGEFELSGNLLRVDDTIDFLNLRNDLLAGNQRLVGNSGDLDGRGGELRLGVWDSLELFYRQTGQDLALNIGPVSSADIDNLDTQLRTEREAYGVKWVFFESLNQDLSQPWTSAALELTSSQNRSDDFGGDLAGFRFSATGGVTFDPPGRFGLDRLRDEGWGARLLFSSALNASTTTTAWAGYGQTEASSGTSWDIDVGFFRDAFLQTFDIEESQYRLGASVNWQYFPRLPVQVGYEYIAITDRKQTIKRGEGSLSRLIPSFLNGGGLAESETRNHTVYGSVNWWVTPQIYLGAGGKLFSSQFTGIIPHYNNPLSSSFSDITYGYVELKLGVKFSIGAGR
ncbi:hypothetical protein N8540_04355 [Gammaproteobacteria bacterium]|nr:hypothetical protein [Gammaproteobacteria bacterium]